jgi:hypothetical protein
MLYGTVLLLAYVLLSGATFSFDTSPKYLGSLVYLAVFGSVIAFSSYLTLVGRIEADRAAFASILFSIVALFISAALGKYRLTLLSALGSPVFSLETLCPKTSRRPDKDRCWTSKRRPYFLTADATMLRASAALETLPRTATDEEVGMVRRLLSICRREES